MRALSTYPTGSLRFLSVLTVLSLYLLVKCQSTHCRHRYMLHTVKNLSPIKNTRWGLPHYTTSGDFEIPLVKHSLLKSMLVMFSISLRFATFPLSFFLFGSAEWLCLLFSAQIWQAFLFVSSFSNEFCHWTSCDFC